MAPRTERSRYVGSEVGQDKRETSIPPPKKHMPASRHSVTPHPVPVTPAEVPGSTGRQWKGWKFEFFPRRTVDPGTSPG